MAKIIIDKKDIIIEDDHMLSFYKDDDIELYYLGKNQSFDKIEEILYFPKFKLSAVIRYKEKIFIYRDRYSIAPWYYIKISDTRTVLSDRYSDFDHDLLKNNIPDRKRFLSCAYGFEDDISKTMFKNVRRIPPGFIYDISDMKRKIIKKKKSGKDTYSNILKNVIIENGVENDKRYGLMLSEGLDSGVLCKTFQMLNIRHMDYSIVFDRSSEEIIDKRDKKINRFYYDELERYINGSGFNSIDFDFNPNANIFLPIIHKMKDDAVNEVFLGVGGDEIHGSDFPAAYLWDCIVGGRWDQLSFNFRFLKFILTNIPNGIYKGSFLKFKIKKVLSSYFFINNIEKIWMLFTKYDILPNLPFYDSRLVEYIMDSNVFHNVSFDRDKGIIVKENNQNILNDEYLKRDFLDIILKTINIKKNKYNDWIYNRSWDLFKKNMNKLSK